MCQLQVLIQTIKIVCLLCCTYVLIQTMLLRLPFYNFGPGWLQITVIYCNKITFTNIAFSIVTNRHNWALGMHFFYWVFNIFLTAVCEIPQLHYDTENHLPWLMVYTAELEPVGRYDLNSSQLVLPPWWLHRPSRWLMPKQHSGNAEKEEIHARKVKVTFFTTRRVSPCKNVKGWQ